MMSKKFHWGILGTGSIASKFATDLQNLPDADCYAVGSRSVESAKRFGGRFGSVKNYGSYEALMADPDVDAIYIATPHPFHKENTLACLAAGKPVLCEKPFAINSADSIEMVQQAREHGVFLMEAMWTRFLPVQVKVREWLADGMIGEPLSLVCDFGFRAGFNPGSRLFDPALGGGALLDVGIYTLSYASMVFGSQPERIQADATLGETGVDEQNAELLTYKNGAQAQLSSSIRVTTEQRVRISGTEGSITVPNFWHATEATLVKADGSTERATGESGYHFEAAEVMRCVREGKLENDVMPLDETIDIMRTMDAVRILIGLQYPME
jgi:dihydrodiol dehydrogenase / D-xylose 1-dehydrogenase (NADP)